MSDTPRTDARWKAEWNRAKTDPRSSPAQGMADLAEEFERDLSTTRQQLLAAQVEVKRLRDALSGVNTTCTGTNATGGAGYCGLTATTMVEWSDRQMRVCDAHIEEAKHHAANDNSSDRTDTPWLHKLVASELAKEIDSLLATPPDLSALSLHDAQKQREVLEKILEPIEGGYYQVIGEVKDALNVMLAELDQAPQGEKP